MTRKSELVSVPYRENPGAALAEIRSLQRAVKRLTEQNGALRTALFGRHDLYPFDASGVCRKCGRAGHKVREFEPGVSDGWFRSGRPERFRVVCKREYERSLYPDDGCGAVYYEMPRDASAAIAAAGENDG